MKRRDLLFTAAALPLSAQQAAWKPSVLDDHQNKTVIALVDLIIPATDTPGAKAALVNRHIDLALRDGDAAQRERFLAGLASLHGAAIREHGHPFAACTPEQQTATLTGMQNTLFFRSAKAMTSRFYYATQIGFRELNKGGRVPAAYGCKHGPHG